MTEVATDWVLPFRLERQLDPDAPATSAASWTAIGNLGSKHDAIVDQRGLVTPWLCGWSLDWWVGADDRWHLPSREVAVRQRRIDDMPVVETAMRVPTGDAVHRVYGVQHGDEELVIVEIENRSKLPFALALALRPYNADGPASIERIALHDSTAVMIDGRLAMRFPKQPSRMAASTSRDGDVASIVFSGGAAETLPEQSRDVGGRASAAFIFPLAHTATLRIALPVAGRRATKVPDRPSADQVARGWRTHIERGMRIEIPDSGLQSRVAAERAVLLLVTPHRVDPNDVVSVLGALDRFGYEREVAEVLRDGGSLLAAIIEHWRLHRDVALVRELLPMIAAAAEDVARKRGSARSLLGVAELLDAVGEVRGAADARRLAVSLPSVDDAGLDSASAELLLSVRDLLVREVDNGLALCTRVPDDWLGQGIEVHDAPTHRGLLSYAIRWHGDRPALLWELVSHDGVTSCRFSVPGLDPTWSSTALSGEALLAPVAPPGQVSAVSLRKR